MGFERILRHGTLIAVTVLILCVLGVSAALSVPVQMIPDLEVRTISVDTRWPGHHHVTWSRKFSLSRNSTCAPYPICAVWFPLPVRGKLILS